MNPTKDWKGIIKKCKRLEQQLSKEKAASMREFEWLILTLFLV